MGCVSSKAERDAGFAPNANHFQVIWFRRCYYTIQLLPHRVDQCNVLPPLTWKCSSHIYIYIYVERGESLGDVGWVKFDVCTWRYSNVEIAAATASRIDQSSHFSGAEEEEEEEEEGGRPSPAYGPFLPLPKCHLWCDAPFPPPT